MITEEETALLFELKKMKEKHCGRGITLTVDDAMDYETGLLLRLRRTKSPSLREAITRYLNAKSGLSRRSRAEYGTYLRRILRESGDAAEKKLSEINVDEWRSILQKTYPTPAGRNKARRLLHGLHEYAIVHKWITHNHIYELSTETEIKRALSILKPNQIQALLRTLLQPHYTSLAAAVGFMLWEGSRVCELKKQDWEDVHLPLLSPALQQWLHRLPKQYHGPIIPSNWTIQWRSLRAEAGLTDWQNDTLRHTYAFYHLNYYHKPEELTERFKRLSSGDIVKQLNSHGKISREEAAAYWTGAWYADVFNHGTNE